MSIYGTFFLIEDERQWIEELEADGIDAGVIRDGEPSEEDLDGPLIYQGSHVLPEPNDPRGGSVDLGCIAPHVRFWRENPDALVAEELDVPYEPYLRLSVNESRSQPNRSEGQATVLLTVDQTERLIQALTEWVGNTR